MRIFRCKCVFLGVIWVFLGVILQNLPGGMTAHPPRMVVRKLVCDVTQLWRNLPPPQKFSAYATECTACSGFLLESHLSSLCKDRLISV